jgi:hypothetical protein
MDPVAALSQGHGVTVGQLLRRRRAVRDHRETLMTNDALFDAELFEAAAQGVPGL